MFRARECLLKALEDTPSTAPEAILPFVRKKIDEFICGADQFDDITMLAVRFNGPAEGPQAHG